MEFLIPLKDILIGPGKRFDPSTGSEDDVIALIKKTYGFLAEGDKGTGMQRHVNGRIVQDRQSRLGHNPVHR